MTGPRAVRLTAATASLAICLTGCHGGGASSQPHGGAKTLSQRPGPVRTVVRNFHRYRAGQTGVVSSPGRHASLRITVSRPTLSTTSLSSSYGDPPRYGHYVTFRLTIRNAGTMPALVRRLDFWVRTAGVAKTTTDAGNAPYSGSGSQLDSTVLAPGHQVRNKLTFDVAHPAGTLFYGSGGHRQIAWTF